MLITPKQDRHILLPSKTKPKQRSCAARVVMQVCSTCGDAPHFDVVSFRKGLLRVETLVLVFFCVLRLCFVLRVETLVIDYCY